MTFIASRIICGRGDSRVWMGHNYSSKAR